MSLLVVLILVDFSIYKAVITKESKKNAAIEATKQAELDLLSSEIAWLNKVSSNNLAADNVQIKEISQALMFFSRDLKIRQVDFAMTFHKVAVSGEASNAIVDLTSRIVTINNQSYMPVDLSGKFTTLLDLELFVKDCIKQGYLVRKLSIQEGKIIDLSLFLPVKQGI